MLLTHPDSPLDKDTHAPTDARSSLFGIETAKKYENFYTSVGFHPECMDTLPENYMQVLDELYLKACSTHKLVAVGEIGLDYHYEGYDKERQIKLFDKQVEYAVKKSLPVIVHCREATQDCLDVLNKYAPSGVVHCFSGSAETAEIVLGLGMYIGFTGALAFKNAKKARRALEVVPMDRLLLETDCPYMAPEPNRGRRNSSLNLPYVAEALAQIKGITAEEVIAVTEENAKRLLFRA